MKVLGLVVAVMVLGACGSKVGSGGATAPTTVAAPPAPRTRPSRRRRSTPSCPASTRRRWRGTSQPGGGVGPVGADQARRDALSPGPGWPGHGGRRCRAVVDATPPASTPGPRPALIRPPPERRPSGSGRRPGSTCRRPTSPSADGRTVTAVEHLDGVPSPLPFVVVVAADGPPWCRPAATSSHRRRRPPAGPHRHGGGARPAGDGTGRRRPRRAAAAPRPTRRRPWPR